MKEKKTYASGRWWLGDEACVNNREPETNGAQ